MGKLECLRCTAKAEASTFEEADSLIDHAFGRIISRDCAGDDKDLLWNGKPAFDVVYQRASTAETPKASSTSVGKPKAKSNKK